jgi:hypothetical protein
MASSWAGSLHIFMSIKCLCPEVAEFGLNCSHKPPYPKGFHSIVGSVNQVSPTVKIVYHSFSEDSCLPNCSEHASRGLSIHWIANCINNKHCFTMVTYNGLVSIRTVWEMHFFKL